MITIATQFFFPVLLPVRALRKRSTKRNKRKVVSGSRVTLPVNFACKPGLSYNPLARVTLAVGLPYLLVNRALGRKTLFNNFLISSFKAELELSLVPLDPHINYLNISLRFSQPCIVLHCHKIGFVHKIMKH